MRKNIAQVNSYIVSYCKETDAHWCETELKLFEEKVRAYDVRAKDASTD